MENGQWVVNEGESKDASEIGSEQDGFRVPWNKENSTTIQVPVETLDNMVSATEERGAGGGEDGGGSLRAA